MTISIVRWLAFFAFLGISAFASAAEELDCKSPQVAFAKTICSDSGLKANLTLIASKIAPEKPALVWFKPLVHDCEKNTECMRQLLFIEWLKYSTTVSPSRQNLTEPQIKRSCEAFKQLINHDLTTEITKSRTLQNHSNLPKEVAPLDVPDAEDALVQADIDLQESVFAGSFDTKVFPLTSNSDIRTAFLSKGGSLGCSYGKIATVLRKNDADRPPASQYTLQATNIEGGCIPNDIAFYEYANTIFLVDRFNQLDYKSYGIFELPHTPSYQALCKIEANTSLSYKIKVNHCNTKELPACSLVRKKVINLAKHFDQRDKFPSKKDSSENHLIPDLVEDTQDRYIETERDGSEPELDSIRYRLSRQLIFA